jgi:hypothetical protein
LEARVSRFAQFRFVVAASLLCSLWLPSLAADGAIGHPAPRNPSFIVVGFTGGFVRHDDLHQGPVQLAARLRQAFSNDAYVQVFENRHRRAALHTIVHLLDTDHDGSLSRAERARARVILYGHSWGAAAVVLLARELDRAGIPVLLTIQVDSVAKFWQQDAVIPDNVAAAANFYQPHGLVHGRSLIWAANGSKTQILGNYRFDYHQTPVECHDLSWFDRTFMSNHMKSECDPNLWSEVETLVRQRLETGQTVASGPLP